MYKKIIESKQWTLKARDFVKGAVIAVITPVFTIMIQSFEAGNLTIDMKAITTVAAGAFLSYLLKNIGEPTQTVEITKQIKKK